MLARNPFKTPHLARTWRLLLAAAASLATLITPGLCAFQPREAFRILFGPDRAQLGSKVEAGQFSFPRDFTMDASGRIYIIDSNKHRVARYAMDGRYEMGFAYPASARQIFAHADDRQNLWLLFSDPRQGVYCGVYDAQGKRLRETLFSQYDQYYLHLDDDSVLRVIVSSAKNPERSQIFIVDPDRLVLRRDTAARPPEDHHRVVRQDRQFFIDVVPGTDRDGQPLNRITDPQRRRIAEIHGKVLYVTANGEVLTRVGACELKRYDLAGRLKGRLRLTGFPASCASIRFDPEGRIYQLDGIPDTSGAYTAQMPGLRMMVWEP